MSDLFDRMRRDRGPLGKWANVAEGYFAFPKLDQKEYKKFSSRFWSRLVSSKYMEYMWPSGEGVREK